MTVMTIDFFRQFLATAEGIVFTRVILNDHYSMDWTDAVSELYGRICAPLTIGTRIPLWNALRELILAVQDGKDDEDIHPIMKRVELLFEDFIQKDTHQREKNNGGRPWSGAAERAFGDIGALRGLMLGM